MSIVILVIVVLLIYFYTKFKTEVARQDGFKGEFHLDGVTPKYSYTKQNGKYEGEWKSFYSNGKIKEIKYFSKGILDGKFVRYDLDGNIEEKGLYIKNKKDGRWETFHENGDVKTNRQFENGIEDKSYYCEFNKGAITHMTQEELNSEEFQDYGYTSIKKYNEAIDEIEKGLKDG